MSAAWMIGPIWAEEMRSLGKRQVKEKRKIFLLYYEPGRKLSFTQKVEPQNLELEFFMAGAAETLQV